ncbi:non-secretory ribonuclease-like [Equus asinus]|uniref:non-secretory ribonuclease-like n=1 Tax=Equus asinus TaxID=9793 RepID=UPI0038F6F836
MVPTQRDSRLCLLLLLGILGMVISYHATPASLTRAQWFEIQHIKNMTHRRCNNEMLRVNNYTKRCKNINTFLHTTFAFVASVCNTPNVTCPTTGYMNCHNSSVQVDITDCNLTSAPQPYKNCTYRQTSARKYFIVACNNSQPGDNAAYSVVPVHLDWIS